MLIFKGFIWCKGIGHGTRGAGKYLILGDSILVST